MKTSVLFSKLILLLAIFAAFACHKDEPEDKTILYPTWYNSKLNILIDSSFVVQPGVIYSIAATLPTGTKIKIVCQPSEGYDWGATGIMTNEANGFTVQDNYPSNIILTATGKDETINLPLMFGSFPSSVITSMDFLIYENDATEYTRIKTVKTQQ